MRYFDDLTFLQLVLNRKLPMARDQSWPDLYSVQLLRRGALDFGRDHNGLVRLQAPALLWIDPRHNYQLRPVTGDDLRHVIEFRGPRAARLLTDGFERLGVQGWVSLRFTHTLERIYHEFPQPVESLSEPQHAQAVLLLEELLLAMLKPGNQAAQLSAHSEPMAALIQQLREDPYGDYDFRTLARRLHLSYTHFRRLFRLQCGHAPGIFLLRARMQCAARALRDPRRQVKQVASEAGYEDAAEFSRVFRRHMGLSPKHYRAALT